MRVNILKYVLFSIIICFFEYGKNEIWHERNIIKFRSNRILGDVEKEFDLNDFYESTFSLTKQLNEQSTLPDLNKLDKRTKKLIYKIREELKEVKKEIDNMGDSGITTKVIENKRIRKKDENNYVSEGEDYNQLKNEVNFLEREYRQPNLSSVNTYKNKRKINELYEGLKLRSILLVFLSLVIIISGTVPIAFTVLCSVVSFETFIRSCQYIKLIMKVYKKPKKSKTSK
ncbi:fam-b protein [Plasmodium yoelii yoelii]|uniref:Fam-b protein n=1 Tax=Plasmodium yoelii yoelii TaxID=73239 RepID=A0AAF0AYY4_PLAYO|nr:fam-b protein [Plasmodium yoelii yoelii]